MRFHSGNVLNSTDEPSIVSAKPISFSVRRRAPMWCAKLFWKALGFVRVYGIHIYSRDHPSADACCWFAIGARTLVGSNVDSAPFRLVVRAVQRAHQRGVLGLEVGMVLKPPLRLHPTPRGGKHEPALGPEPGSVRARRHTRVLSSYV
jgi:hypothetical protein